MFSLYCSPCAVTSHIYSVTSLQKILPVSCCFLFTFCVKFLQLFVCLFTFFKCFNTIINWFNTLKKSPGLLVNCVSVIPQASLRAQCLSDPSLFPSHRGRRDCISRAGRSFCGHRRCSRSRGGSFLAKENPPFSLFGSREGM